MYVCWIDSMHAECINMYLQNNNVIMFTSIIKKKIYVRNYKINLFKILIIYTSVLYTYTYICI